MVHVSAPFLEKPDLSGLRMMVMSGSSLLVSQLDSMDRARWHIRLMTGVDQISRITSLTSHNEGM